MCLHTRQAVGADYTEGTMTTALSSTCQFMPFDTFRSPGLEFYYRSGTPYHHCRLSCWLHPEAFPPILGPKCSLSKESLQNSEQKPSGKRVLKCSASQNVGVGPRSEASSDRKGVSPGTETQVLEPAATIGHEEQLGEYKKKDEYLTNAFGWGVLMVNQDDIDVLNQVADVQAEAFHVPTSVFNDFFFTIFKAEVLSALLYKMRHSTPKRYACLAATADSLHLTGRKVVGVVDAAAMGERDVLKNLPGAAEYLYISGMAVDEKYRRQKVATALLQACDLTALQWGFEFLVLQAYEDDTAARNLYSRAGYTLISSDPLWLSKWMGRRRRVILAKRTSKCEAAL